MVKDRSAPFIAQSPRLLVLTNTAIYLMETPVDAQAKLAIHPTKTIPRFVVLLLFVRRLLFVLFW